MRRLASFPFLAALTAVILIAAPISALARGEGGGDTKDGGGKDGGDKTVRL